MQGIPFNAQGIKSIKDNLKTMTRRPLSQQQIFERVHHMTLEEVCEFKVGEIVYAMEEFLYDDSIEQYQYKADIDVNKFGDDAWLSPSEMEQHEARFYLRIKSIKIEMLQAISSEDCMLEGVKYSVPDTSGTLCCFSDGYYNDNFWQYPNEAFKHGIWKNLPYEEPKRWEDNPPVFVYEFERVKQ